MILRPDVKLGAKFVNGHINYQLEFSVNFCLDAFILPTCTPRCISGQFVFSLYLEGAYPLEWTVSGFDLFFFLQGANGLLLLNF